MAASENSNLTRTVLRLLLLIAVVIILYYGQTLLLPIALAGLLAILLNPIDEKLRSWGWSAGLSISGAMFVLLLMFAGLFVAVGQQAISFAENWPETQENISKQLDKLRDQGNFGGLIPKVPSGMDSEASPKQDTASSLPVSRTGIMKFFSGTFGALGDFLLMLVYVVLLLSQKERLQKFLLRRMPDEKRGVTHRTLNESRSVVQKYLRGRLILIGILSVLYSIGFLIIGLDYAILIAILVAVLSIIPYLGNIIGGVFAVALAFAGGGGTTAIVGVLITISVAQMLESYILTPLIVGDEVDINPLTTIFCVVGMSIVWGPVGAIIAIPMFAILRIIFSHVEGLKDYAYLMGQDD